MENYSLLCSLTINHNYFATALCDELSLAPTPSTQQLLDGLHLVFRQTDEGWNIYYDTAFYQPEMLSSFAQQKLSFVLNSSDTCFLNYTQLPPFTNTSILYFSNAGKPKSNSTALSLTSGKFAGNKDLYSLSSSTLSCSTNGTNTNVTLTDPFKNKITGASSDTNSIVFNNLNGAFTLNNNKNTTLIYANDFVYRSKPLAVVELYLYMQGNVYSLFDGGTIAAKNFQINFDSRTAKWRYYIINRTNTIVDTITIASIDNKITFVENGTVSTQNFPTSVLVSKAAIKMQQYPDRQFNLTLKGSNKSSTLNNIVLPSVESLSIENKTNFIDANIYI